MSADFVEYNPSEVVINTPADSLRVIEKTFFQHKLLLYQSNLNPDFFDLSSGLAGEVLQKLVTYQVKTAFVVDTSTIKSERFKELITESNNYDDYRFFENKDDAVNWLQE